MNALILIFRFITRSIIIHQVSYHLPTTFINRTINIYICHVQFFIFTTYPRWKKSHRQNYMQVKILARKYFDRKSTVNRLPITSQSWQTILSPSQSRHVSPSPIQDNYLNSPRNSPRLIPSLLSFLSIPSHERLASTTDPDTVSRQPRPSPGRRVNGYRVFPQQHPLPAEAAIRSR